MQLVTASSISALRAKLNLSDPEGAQVFDAVLSAFTDSLDGVKAHEIREMTGLPMTRCEEIDAVRQAAIASK